MTNPATLTCAVIRFACAILFVSLGQPAMWAQKDVLTQHNDNLRTGLNSHETILTAANVTASKFGKLFMQNVDGIMVGQPLYVSNIRMKDGLIHNVVFVATQHNTVYAFDADNTRGSNASPLWAVSLNDGGTSDPIADFGCVGTRYTEIGITGTPVIDSGRTTLYVVAKTVNAGVRNFNLHALDITSGLERLGGPVVISATAQTNRGILTFSPIYQMQRPALLLENGKVYIGFGGNGCDVYAYHGWLFAYNSQTLQQEAAYLVTPDGDRGSIWQGGSGPAADADGYIYVATANGLFDGPSGSNDYSDSLLKMGWSGSTFGVMDFFTPYNQQQLASEDLDLGSAGPLLLPDQPGLYPHELVVGGKQGTLYLINRDNPGAFNATADNAIQTLPGAVPSELAGVPSYWNGRVFVAGVNDHVKQFSLVNGMLTQQPVSQTPTVFAGAGQESTSVTANGNTNGILWVIRHSNPALFAFDATNLAHEFYDSTKAPQGRDLMIPVTRFVTPTISNGKVFIAGKTALEVYGLLPSISVQSGNNQSGIEKAILPVPLSLRVADSYSAAALAGVAVTCSDGGAGGVFTPGAIQTTSASGVVTYTYQLPNRPRAITITCSSVGYSPASFAETATLGPPVRMTSPSGTGQKAPPLTALANPLVLKVLDAAGYPVPGVTVNFSDNGAGGTLAATSLVTSSAGTVSNQYKTGTKSGKITITASSPGVKSMNVFATCLAGAATSIAVVSGNNQSGTAGTKLLKALTVRVADVYGNPVSGHSVLFSDSGAGGTFSSPNPIVTGTIGTAALFYTLPSSAKSIRVTATATGVSAPAVFTETAH
jgi:hypothetical protein